MEDVRDRRDEDRDGANGDERKRKCLSASIGSTNVNLAPVDSPVPAHDELDTAE